MDDDLLHKTDQALLYLADRSDGEGRRGPFTADDPFIAAVGCDHRDARKSIIPILRQKGWLDPDQSPARMTLTATGLEAAQALRKAKGILTTQQRSVLNLISEAYFAAEQSSPLSGTLIRYRMAGDDFEAKQATLAELSTRFLRREESAVTGDDYYALTGDGLLASTRGPTARALLEAIRHVLIAKSNVDPEFIAFSFNEVARTLSHPSATPDLVGKVICIFGVAHSERGFDGSVAWHRPDKCEALLSGADADTFVVRLLARMAPRPRINAKGVPSRARIEATLDVSGAKAKLTFISDAKLREIIARDMDELRITLDEAMLKAALLMCGSVLEGILVGAAARNTTVAKTYCDQKKKSFPDGYSLQDLIRVMLGEGLFETSVSGMASSVVDHRDLIHPAAEARGAAKVSPERAAAMVAFLNVAIAALADAATDGRFQAYADK